MKERKLIRRSRGHRKRVRLMKYMGLLGFVYGKICRRRPSYLALRGPRAKKGPPHPGPLLHKYVEERGIERGLLFCGLDARSLSGKSLHGLRARREPPHPG